MKKSEIIERYGEEEYKRRLEQMRAYNKANREEQKARVKNYRDTHPEKVEATSREQRRKGGKYYNKKLKYNHTGIQGAKNVIRRRHAKQYRPFKMLIAPESQIHHEWIPETAEYRGLALVETNPHRYGIIDVILILDGEITLLTEEEIRKRAAEEDWI